MTTSIQIDSSIFAKVDAIVSVAETNLKKVESQKIARIEQEENDRLVHLEQVKRQMADQEEDERLFGQILEKSIINLIAFGSHKRVQETIAILGILPLCFIDADAGAEFSSDDNLTISFLQASIDLMIHSHGMTWGCCVSYNADPADHKKLLAFHERVRPGEELQTEDPYSPVVYTMKQKHSPEELLLLQKKTYDYSLIMDFCEGTLLSDLFKAWTDPEEIQNFVNHSLSVIKV